MTYPQCAPGVGRNWQRQIHEGIKRDGLFLAVQTRDRRLEETLENKESKSNEFPFCLVLSCVKTSHDPRSRQFRTHLKHIDDDGVVDLFVEPPRLVRRLVVRQSVIVLFWNLWASFDLETKNANVTQESPRDKTNKLQSRKHWEYLVQIFMQTVHQGEKKFLRILLLVASKRWVAL